MQPEGITVEQSWILDLYTLFHRRDLRAYRIAFPGHGGQTAHAHLLLPPGNGPHPLVIVFPILAGSHVVSEGLAKALANRGRAVLRLERRPLAFETSEEPELVGRVFRESVRDARRLIDWAEQQPALDIDRLTVAGVSLGGILASVLMGVEPRVGAGFFVMSGGGLAELLHDSTEKPVRIFRNRLVERLALPDREAFVAHMQRYTQDVEPLRFASAIDPRDVLLVSGRFDRVVPPARTRALWRALGEPTWRRFPAGHYQLAPFFWWSIHRGLDHLEARERDARHGEAVGR